MKYTTEHLDKAHLIAKAFHAGQTYGKRDYYHYHLRGVADLLFEFGITDPFSQCVGLLHDTLEDTPMTFDILEDLFDYEIAHTVWLLTDKLPKEPRIVRHRATYPLIAQDIIATRVKVADRLFNMRQHTKNEMYVREYPYFKSTLYSPDDTYARAMWSELDTLVTFYQLSH
jgi:GTP pyrophosphokinase